MKKGLLLILTVMTLILGGNAAAQENIYPTRNEFFDDDALMYAACANGMLYTQCESGIYAVAPDGDKSHLIQASDLPAWIDHFLSDGHALYLLTSDDKLTLTMLVDESGFYVNRQVFEMDMEMGSYIQNPVIKNGKFYFMVPMNGQVSITIHELETDESKTLTTPNIISFDVMNDGRLIALQRQINWPEITLALVTVTPDTSETIQWAEIEMTENLNHLTYDTKTDTVYLFDRSSIFATQQNGVLHQVDNFLAGDIASVALLDSGMALVVDGILVIRNFAAADRTRQITILDEYGRGEDYRAFLEANPEIDLQFVEPGSTTPDEKFIQDMLIRDDHVDIYILSDLNLLGILKSKGYFVDLAGNTDIQSLVTQMYEPFREAFCAGNQIAAFPRETFLEVLCYHKPTFDALHLTIPDTYEEFFDFCLEWLNEYADDYPDIVLGSFVSNLSLEELLARYTDERTGNNQPLQYRTEDMVQLIIKYLAVQEKLSERREYSQRGISLFYCYDIPRLDEQDDYAYLPLRFGRNAKAVISPQENSFRYFVVNPYGKSSQDALAFLVAYDGQRMEIETALLYENINGAIESKTYQSEYALMHMALETLEARLEKAEPENHSELAEQIELQRLKMANYEQTSRWAVSQGALTAYKNLSNSIYVNSFNPVTALEDNMPFLFDEQNSSITTFLTALDNKVQMILLENGIW